MIDKHLHTVEQSIALARKKRSLEKLGALMFKHFFELHPEADVFFEGFDMAEIMPYKFCKVGDALVDVLKYPSYSETSLSEEVFRHQVHNVKDKEYYFALADAYVYAIKDTLGEDWTHELAECWSDTVAGLRHNVDLAAREVLGA